MAAKQKIPSTPAVRALKAAKVEFVPRPYAYEDHGGTEVAARELGVDEHAVIKTLVMAGPDGEPFYVLMHGDREVSTKALARELGLKSVAPMGQKDAERFTGYQVGGISPFGPRRAMKVNAQASIFELPRIYINAGKRGLLAEMDPAELRRVLQPNLVDAAL